MRVLCFGNEFVESDLLALKVADEVRIEGIEFVKCESPDDISDYIESGRVAIMDVARGIKKVEILRDLDNLLMQSLCTCHDFDLAFHLKLLREIGELNEVIIIALPMNANLPIVEKELRSLIPDDIQEVG